MKLVSLLLMAACAAPSTDTNSNNNNNNNSNNSADAAPRTGSCRVNSTLGSCWCDTGSVGSPLQSDETAVANCATPPSPNTWNCCYDLDSTGKTAFCQCAVATCLARDGSFDCECGYAADHEGNEKVAATCSSDKCCTDGENCFCTGNQFTTCSYPTGVSSCAKPTAARKCDSSMRFATSCAGLKWK